MLFGNSGQMLHAHSNSTSLEHMIGRLRADLGEVGIGRWNQTNISRENSRGDPSLGPVCSNIRHAFLSGTPASVEDGWP